MIITSSLKHHGWWISSTKSNDFSKLAADTNGLNGEILQSVKQKIKHSVQIIMQNNSRSISTSFILVCAVLLLIWHQWAALSVCLEVLNAPLTRCSLLLDPLDCQAR